MRNTIFASIGVAFIAGARASASFGAKQSAAGSCVRRRHPKNRSGGRLKRGPDAAQKHPPPAKSAGDLGTCAPRARDAAPLTPRTPFRFSPARAFRPSSC